MRKYLFLLLITFGIVSSCSKESPSNSSQKLYTRSLDQIKKSLLGSWDLRSVCNTTIAGSECHDITNESLIFSDNDSMYWLENNEIIIKAKIEFKRVKALERYGYKTDSLYVFRIAKDQGFYFPYDIRHDSLIIQDVIDAIDAGFQMTLTKSK